MFRLNLVSCGLILVFVPLVCELAVFAVIVPMLEQEKVQTEREARARTIVLAADELAIMLTTASSQLIEATLEPEIRMQLRQKHRETLNAIEARRKSIESAAKGNASFEDLSRKVNRITERALYSMRALSTGSDKPPFVLAMEITPLVTARANEILEVTINLGGRSNSADSAFPEFEHARIRGVVSILWGFIFASIVISVSLVLFFAMTFVNRITLLRSNTERFARREELLAPMSGSDELCDLDRAFHDMYAAVKHNAAVKQQFFALVSHDLRTPLTSLRLVLSLLNTGALGTLNEKGVKKVAAAESDTDRLLSLINDLLDAERLEQGQIEIDPEQAWLRSILERSIKSIQPIAESKKIRIELLASEEDTVYADSDRVVQVLVNLISNALKYAPVNSVIRVTAEAQNEMVYVAVVDDGPGIPVAKQESLFNRFKQVSTSDANTGTGLGLFICKAIVNQHGGEIGVESNFGHGCKFWFTLPASAAQFKQHRSLAPVQ